MAFEYRVVTRGVSASWDNLEGIGDKLETLLNREEARALENEGFELWRLQLAEQIGSNNGWLLIYRRLLTHGFLETTE